MSVDGHEAPGRAARRAWRFARAGALSWWATLLVLLPLVGRFAWFVATIMLYSSYRNSDDEATRANARNALNWMITYQIVLFVLWIAAMAVVFVDVDLPSTTTAAGGELPVLTTVLLDASLPVVVFAVVMGVLGGIRAGSGRVLRAYLAIPFVRGA